jgi:hypothetical protein
MFNVEHNKEGKDSIGDLVPPLPPTGATAILSLLLLSLLSLSLSSSTLLNKKQKLNKAICNDNVSLLADDYPHLSNALGQEDRFNPVDPTMQKIMQLLLVEFFDLLGPDYELNVIDFAKNSLSYF